MLELVKQIWDIYILLTKTLQIDSIFYGGYKVSIYIFYVLVEHNFLVIDGLSDYV